MTRAIVAFPGRGSYTTASLRSLPRHHPWVARADELRAAASLPSVSELDGATAFDPAVHARPSNAWPLTLLSSLLDAERIARDHDVVAVLGSSTGWYTALAATGALGFDDALRLVQELSRAADDELPGGVAELIYPLDDEAWRPDSSRADALAKAFAGLNGDAHRAQHLGSYALLAGTTAGIGVVESRLPKVVIGERAFPLRLAVADGWHTPLRAGSVAAARERLRDLEWHRPGVALIDGRGARYSPSSTDPAQLAAYTLGEHPTTTYDFAAALRVALREYAPDVVLLPGPGATLGAGCAHVIVNEGYAGIRTRADFERVQSGASPILLSLRR